MSEQAVFTGDLLDYTEWKMSFLGLSDLSNFLKNFRAASQHVAGVQILDNCHENQAQKVMVAPGNGHSLLGRNWLRHIQLDWRQVHRIK